MSYLRAVTKLIVLLAMTSGYYLIYAIGRVFVAASHNLCMAWRRRVFVSWARGVARLLTLKINTCNSQPSPPFLLVSNHLSYVDVVVLESQSDCAFVAKSEVAQWPVLGRLCRTMDTIFIDRKTKRDIPRALKKIERVLELGMGVVLFAEGTSTNGTSVAPFKSSLLDVAARNRVPVHYVTISYRTPSKTTPQESICWWGDMTFSSHLFRLLRIPSFEADVVYGPEPIVAEDRHLLAARLWSAVSSQLAPVVHR